MGSIQNWFPSYVPPKKKPKLQLITNQTQLQRPRMKGPLDPGGIMQRKVLESLCTTEVSLHGGAFPRSNTSLAYKA